MWTERFVMWFSWVVIRSADGFKVSLLKGVMMFRKKPKP